MRARDRIEGGRRRVARARFNMLLLLAFALQALVLAAVGIYGFQSYEDSSVSSLPI